ncbi:MAG TPA: hypothetical protein VF731_02380 [Solirubrobacterales bacterium]
MRVVIGLLVALALGLMAGRLSASASSEPVRAPVLRAAAPAPGASREVAGVPLGFPRSRAGAALAAGSYQQAFADKAILRPGELRRRIEVVATPGFAAAMLEANEPGDSRLAAGPFGQGLRAGVESAFFGVPVAYRLLSYTARKAVVETWGFSLIGNVAALEPTAYFGLARTVLVWEGGDWKIADTRASFGPTPRLGSPRRGGEALGLVELAEELRPYGIAP